MTKGLRLWCFVAKTFLAFVVNFDLRDTEVMEWGFSTRLHCICDRSLKGICCLLDGNVRVDVGFMLINQGFLSLSVRSHPVLISFRKKIRCLKGNWRIKYIHFITFPGISHTTFKVRKFVIV